MNRNSHWFTKILIFDGIVIAFYLLAPKFPLQSSLCLLLILCNLFVGSILKLYEQRDDRNNRRFDMPTALNEKQKKNAQNLLRYATAVMAFLSLTTTAQGMHGYVFKKMWLAYLGSFGVQSILVVFSLLLCRFYVTVGKCQWHDYIKKSVKLSMVLFFSLSLMVSSVFSFTYIADNAYADSWASDRESMIQTYLTNESYRLQQENERRGKILIDKIYNIINEDLSQSMKTIEQDETEKTNETVKELIDNIKDNSKSLKPEVTIDLSGKINGNNKQYIDDLQNNFDQELKLNYENAVKNYSETIKDINSLKSTFSDISDSKFYNDLTTIIDDINDFKNDIKNLKQQITYWSNSQLILDVNTERNMLDTDTNTLEHYFDRLNQKLTDIKNILDNTNNNTTDSVTNKLTALIKDIYSLKITEDSTKDNNNLINTITNNISDILETITSDDSFSGEHTKALVDLKDYIEQYQKYIELQKNLKNYCDIDMKTVYNILIEKDPNEKRKDNKTNKSSDTKSNTDKNVKTSDKKKDASNSALDTTKQKNSSANTKELTEKKWAEERNEDFFEFIGYLKSLPDITAIDIEDDNITSESKESENTDSNNSSDDSQNTNKNYNTTEASQNTNSNNSSDNSEHTDANGSSNNSKDTETNNSSDNTTVWEKIFSDNTNTNFKEIYDSDKVLEKTSTMQRNFLGNLTMFERAFNYFLYDYKMMAFFSAFIAIYLDLSAFLVGCFLYFTEIFKEKA